MRVFQLKFGSRGVSINFQLIMYLDNGLQASMDKILHTEDIDALERENDSILFKTRACP